MEIQKNIPLAQYTTFKIGGEARFFCEAENEDEIVEALKFAQEKKLPVFILGGGSNILVSDKGFDGLVIKILNTLYSILDTKIECGAGCPLSKIVSESAKAGLTGLGWAAGIPGTIGGAVRGNAGAFNSSMGEIVESIRVIEVPSSKSEAPNIFEVRISNFENKDCRFSYRDSVFKQDPNLMILSVVLELQKGDRAGNEKLIKEILAKRKKSQPEFPTPGSFFKNPETKSQKLIKEFERDTGNKAKNNIIPAGYLIDRTGLKGKKVGGAMVSEKHANFIVNAGKATAEDVVTLAAIVKTKVRNKFGIQLQEEVQYVGF